MKNTRIKCKTIEEAKKVLQMIEDRHPEVRWGEGQKPTEFHPWERDESMKECWLNVCENSISYTTPDTHYPDLWVNATSAKRFIRKSNTSIHIYQRGRMVIAHESETGREGIAKCSPDDKFDFSIGARIALLRLFGEEVPDSLTGNEKVGESHKPTKFRVGDFVTLKKDIKESESVGGIFIYGPMYVMGHGRPMRVTNVDDTPSYGIVYDCKGTNGKYIFPEDALEKWEEIKEGDRVKITNTGKCYSTYSTWVAQNVDDKEMVARYVYGSYPSSGTEGIVKKVAPHESIDELLAYVDTGRSYGCVLVGVKGLTKIES
jgi:hypothetical protein